MTLPLLVKISDVTCKFDLVIYVLFMYTYLVSLFAFLSLFIEIFTWLLLVSGPFKPWVCFFRVSQNQSVRDVKRSIGTPNRKGVIARILDDDRYYSSGQVSSLRGAIRCPRSGLNLACDKRCIFIM